MKRNAIIGLAILTLTLTAFVGVVFAAGHRSEADKKKVAQTAAEAWLKLADEGKYAEAWDQCSANFKRAVTREKLEQQLQTVRGPLGKMISRTVNNSAYSTTAPGAPDGEYVKIQFDSSFANKKTAVETITVMLDPDGKWRVWQYLIK